MLNGLGKACPCLSFCYFVKLFNFFFMALLIVYTIKNLLAPKKTRFSNFFLLSRQEKVDLFAFAKQDFVFS